MCKAINHMNVLCLSARGLGDIIAPLEIRAVNAVKEQVLIPTGPYCSGASLFR